MCVPMATPPANPERSSGPGWLWVERLPQGPSLTALPCLAAERGVQAYHRRTEAPADQVPVGPGCPGLGEGAAHIANDRGFPPGRSCLHPRDHLAHVPHFVLHRQQPNAGKK